MSTIYIGFSLNGTTKVALRAHVEAVRCHPSRGCHDCNFTSAAGTQCRICSAAGTMIPSKENWDTFIAKAIQAGHLHKCGGRYYSKGKVSHAGRVLNAWEYYPIPRSDYGLQAKDCPCGANRQTVVRYAAADPGVIYGMIPPPTVFFWG
jgi:hypothetical protein